MLKEFGTVLGLSGIGWEGLGILLGAFGRLLVVFWTFELELFSSVGPTWAPKGLLDSFWVDLGRNLERFWQDLEGFGMLLGWIWMDFGIIYEGFCCFFAAVFADAKVAWYETK